MATAILDIDLSNSPTEIGGLSKYSRAFMLIRYKGQPLGKVTVRVNDGCIKVTELFPKIYDEVWGNLWQARVHDYLGWDERKMPGVSLPAATIAVCTRNRTEDLRRCLDALVELPDDGQEVLVVDNCPSNNDTQDLVARYPKVHYVREGRPGLDVARNRALREASGEVVAFIDDDAMPDKNWLRELTANFNNPMVMCVTGITMPLELETDGQEAFEKYSPFSKGFRRIVYSAASHHPLSAGRIGAGANMAFRKQVISTVGTFDEALDAGTATESGGDHEYFVRILLAGYKIVYEPRALNWHRHRRTMQETRKAIRGYGIGVYAFWTRLLLEEKQYGILRFPLNWFFYSQLPNLIRSLLRRPNRRPLGLLLAELEGCFLGPSKYLSAKKKLKQNRLKYESA
jgi:glycosyltransferase involved in cell wall biosynthesis